MKVNFYFVTRGEDDTHKGEIFIECEKCGAQFSDIKHGNAMMVSCMIVAQDHASRYHRSSGGLFTSRKKEAEREAKNATLRVLRGR